MTSKDAAAAVEARAPQRVLDTRNGLGAAAGRLQPGQVLQLALPAASSAGATSVSLNLTADGAQGSGYVTAWPCDKPMPATSVLNVVPSHAVANFVVLGLPAGGVCLATTTPTHLIADLAGWFTGNNDLVGIAPNRVLDTRASGKALSPGEERRLRIAGTTGVPGSAVAAALNITVTRPAADGYLLAYPCGKVPTASTVNFRAGEDLPNFTIAALDGDDVCLRSSVATDVIVDSFGWLGGGGELTALAPARALDTRQASAWPYGAPLQSGQTFPLRVAGKAGVPNDADAALVTITVDNASSAGYVTAWPCDQPRPTASVLNLFPAALRSNLVSVKLAADGTVCLAATTYDGSPVHLIVDAVGTVDGGPARSDPPADPPPPTGPAPGGRFETLPPGSALPSDAQCAAAVRSAAEVRPQNATYNARTGPPGGAPSEPRVTGNFTGTTDEILQWVACKWGIDEDVVRAQVAKESWWKQTATGDWTSNSADCAPGHPIGADGRSGQCPESIGLMQVRTPYFRDTIAGAVTSSAYNVDVGYAVWRGCFEGEETWLNTVERGREYAAGDMWGCLGRWFSGRWHTAAAEEYISAVGNFLEQRVWESPSFLSDHTP